MTDSSSPRRWWLAPLLFGIAILAGLAVAWKMNETAREVIAKGVMTLAGTLATPFILESSIALVGLAIVLTINQWRLQKEGDGWVYLAQTEPDAASVAAGAQTPSKRLDGVILPSIPNRAVDLEARIAIAEGYLELGLKQEALDHLQLLSEDEQQHPRARALRAKAI